MKNSFVHLSGEDLILFADGELPARRRAEMKAHLDTCWSCRERIQSLQDTIHDYVRARNHELNAQLPPPTGPRALLRARLAEAASSHAPSFHPPGFSLPVAPLGRLAAAAAALITLLLAVLAIFQSTVMAQKPKPRFAITPGEVRPITLREVCLYPAAEVISRDIPEDVRQRVFSLYGVKSSEAAQFEVDYLITPDLGGTESIRNLWPQPYSVRWNARVKDKLEQRLHDLVCNRKLDIATAQHDIAADWIGAYRKYVGDSSPE